MGFIGRDRERREDADFSHKTAPFHTQHQEREVMKEREGILNIQKW